MRLQSPEPRECSERASMPVEVVAAALCWSVIAVGLGSDPAHAAATETPTDVAYVEEVRGRVVASSQGAPALLDALDIINDRTRLDLQANSELRICHYRTQRLLALKGPLRASISQDGVTAENGKVSAEGSCAAPVVSSFQGGIVSRSTGLKTMNVPLQPSIKIINRGTQAIRRIALWDGEYQRVLMTFDRDAARPKLDDGQAYLLVIERSDGSEFKMMLQGSAAAQTDPLIIMVR
jgi:hypothetical protein